MTPDLALQLMADMLLAALLIGAPILGFSMLVGLVISILQVVTQVQEMSLTFVPKIVTVVVTIVAVRAVDAAQAARLLVRRHRQHPVVLLDARRRCSHVDRPSTSLRWPSVFLVALRVGAAVRAGAGVRRRRDPGARARVRSRSRSRSCWRRPSQPAARRRSRSTPARCSPRRSPSWCSAWRWRSACSPRSARSCSAGALLDMQIGFGIASLIDPTTRSQSPLLGTALNLLAVAVFFAVDGAPRGGARRWPGRCSTCRPGRRSARSIRRPIAAQFGVDVRATGWCSSRRRCSRCCCSTSRSRSSRGRCRR